MNKLEKAFELFDSYNKQDPNTIIWDDTTYASEYFYALKLHQWVKELAPNASEALLLASRAQHIGRWTSPRTSYADGKAGYLQWRIDLAKFHAAKAAQLMKEAGYDDEVTGAVQHIMLKKDLRTDPEVQTIENALCLVFLQYQYEDFISKHDEKKITWILQKSWAKMSQPGRDAALTITFSDKGKELIEKAIS